jgi:DNA-binding transcriptional ArsR family regulator
MARDTTLRRLTDPDGRSFALTEQKQSRATFGRRFFVVFDEALEDVVKRFKGGPEVRTFLMCALRLSWTDFRLLPREKLASELEISGASVSHALKALCEAGYIERQGAGPVTQWRLSLKFGWRGSVPAYQRAKREGEARRVAEGGGAGAPRVGAQPGNVAVLPVKGDRKRPRAKLRLAAVAPSEAVDVVPEGQRSLPLLCPVRSGAG